METAASPFWVAEASLLIAEGFGIAAIWSNEAKAYREISFHWLDLGRTSPPLNPARLSDASSAEAIAPRRRGR